MPDTLKIFVSGTMIDLKTERDAVARAIASLRLDAVRAETEFSEDRPSRDKILQMARECDIYLGLYNPTRYGWTIPEDGISVTELEFNESQRLHKPTLIFVKAIPKDWAPRNDDEKLQREQQKKFINRVLDFESGRFRSPEFDSPPELERQAAGALMALLIQRFKVSVTRPPFEVPADLATFVGRAEQIKSLTAALTGGGGARTYLLFGTGGLGKSALAIHLAHTLRDHFDGGVLWADIPTLRPAEQLADWGRAYGEEGLSRIEDLDQRALALRRLLQGKRVLALLDGAVDEQDDEKIAPLLNALADSAVLITSRAAQLPSLQKAERVDLDKLTLQETADLFERIVGPARVANGRAAIRQIGQVVDYLPLALDLAASQLREHKTWTLVDLCSKLSDARGRLETLKWGDGRRRSIRASCEVSYAALESDEQAFFAALGAFSGEDFDTRAAAAAVTTQSEAENELEKLLRLSLVQEGRAAGRYRLHPLLRDYARERAGDLTAAEQRMAEFYCALAQEHRGKIHTDAVHAGLAVLDLERSNIVAAQEWARARNDERGRQLTRDFIYGAMAYYFDLRAQWDELLAWSQAGLVACRELGDEGGQAAMLNNIGNVHARKGEYDAALQAYGESRTISERIGDPATLAGTLNNIGNVHARKGEYDAALRAYGDSRTIIERIGDTAGLGETLNNIGNVHFSKGKYDAALQAYGESRTIKERIGDTAGLAATLMNIGSVHYSKGEYDAALRAYGDSRTIIERIGDTAGLGETLNNIGNVHFSKGKYDAALQAYGESRTIKERIGDRAGLARTLGSIGNVHADKGEYDAALQAYGESRTIAQRIGDAAGLAAMIMGIGNVHYRKGEYDAALQAYGESRTIAQRIGDTAGLARALMGIGNIHRLKGEYDAALQAYGESRTISERIGDFATLAGTLWNIALVYEKQRRLDDAWSLMEQSIEIKRRIGLPDVQKREAYLRDSRARGKPTKKTWPWSRNRK